MLLLKTPFVKACVKITKRMLHKRKINKKLVTEANIVYNCPCFVKG